MDTQSKPKQPAEKKRKHYAGDKSDGKLTKRQKRDGGATRIEPGMVGFFVTSTRGKERQASKEVSAILMERIEAMYPEVMASLTPSSDAPTTDPNAESSASNAKPTSIEDEIAAELKELSSAGKGNHASRNLVHIGTAVDCVFFLQVTPPELAQAMDPVAVVQSAIDEVLAKRESGAGGLGGAKTRFANRIIPFQKVVKAGKEEILSQVAELVKEAGIEGKQKFALAVKLREGAGHLDRNSLIADLANPMIEAGHTVDLSHPQVSIVVEVYRHVAGLCVVKDGHYVRLRKFNLHEVYAKGEEEVLPAKAGKGAMVDEESKAE